MGAILLERDNWYVVGPPNYCTRPYGGGDGFVGGLLYSILRGWDLEKWIHLSGNRGYTTTFLTDYAQPADEEQV